MFTIKMIESPIKGKGLYHFKFFADGQEFGRGAACNPMFQGGVAPQLAQLFSEQLEAAGYDLSDNEVFAKAFHALSDIQ
jgi:hypothetical protein